MIDSATAAGSIFVLRTQHMLWLHQQIICFAATTRNS